jgi:hypothetical protein
VTYPVVKRLEIGAVLNAMASVGAPVVSPVQPLAGGAVGAWKVARSSGELSVLTWRSSREGYDMAAEVQRVSELVAIARTAGVPAPRYEDIIPLPDGSVVVLQEFVHGVRPTAGRAVIASLLDLTDRRRDVLAGSSYPIEGTPLYLTEDGPGFCLHGPLREDERARRLLDWIETVGSSEPDLVVGADVVHFDYHLGNVLVAPEDPSVVVAIVDWDGANAGDVAIDGVILALDLVLYGADAAVVDQVVDHLRQTTPEKRLRACWAHGLLRLVDWRLRHSPHDDLAWMQRAEALARV